MIPHSELPTRVVLSLRCNALDAPVAALTPDTGFFSLAIQLEPIRAGPRDAPRGIIQKELQGRAARKAVASTVVRIDPVDRAVSLYAGACGDADRIEIVEFALHLSGRHGRLPDASRGSAVPSARSRLG